jgi:phthiocerol/phenolphthiocerol synthesis type-I polyketide synthase E
MDQRFIAQDIEAPQYTGLEIAIIGMAGRFPGARNVEQFWRNLKSGLESISFFTDDELRAAGVHASTLNNPNYVKARGVLADAECFDATFFGMTPREATITDPQHRVFLECSWEALEDAGYDPEKYCGSIGVFGGSFSNTYILNVRSHPDLIDAVGDLPILIGNENDHLTTRVSYRLKLTGPSITVQTACSTSLVAVHLAGQSLLSGACDMALAGGSSVKAQQRTGYHFQDGGIFSPDGHCRAFDAEARGSISSSGVGIVVLKRLEDAIRDGDDIRAVILGSAVNNDASRKVGYTAPSVEGQARAIEAAQAMAGVTADTISYLEAHGTGTALGDPIEVEALTRAFRATCDKNGFCALGSVKSNVGHLHTAAGVAGLIKTVLSLEHGLLPPSLHFVEPNPRIDFASTPFYVNTRLSEWKTNGIPRRAGVSSFGIGGTNAHVVVEEAPGREPAGASRPWHLFAISAQTASALEPATDNLAAHLKNYPDLCAADVAYTLHLGRKEFTHRRIAVCKDPGHAATCFDERSPETSLTGSCGAEPPGVTFIFPGLGDQYVGMGSELYRDEPQFREDVDRCCELLRPLLGLDLRPVIFGDPSSPGDQVSALAQNPNTHVRFDLRAMLRRGRDVAPDVGDRSLGSTYLAQPALFVVEYALARLWMSWGIIPGAMIGYSLGEYVAACIAGVLSVEDALILVARRAQMIEDLPRGAMLAIPLPESEILTLLGNDLSLAAVNGPNLCVVGGPLAAIADLERHLDGREVPYRRLQTSHAFHSRMMVPVSDDLTETAASLETKIPSIPYISGETGDWITAEQVLEPRYWARHLCGPVRFADGIERLWGIPSQILLEIGPGQNLCALAMQHPASHQARCVATLPSLRHVYEREADHPLLLRSLGRLWLAGVKIDWASFYARERRRRVSLPTYPFERQRHWIEPAVTSPAAEFASNLPDRIETVDAKDSPERSVVPVAPYRRNNIQTQYVAPRTNLERAVVELWQDSLGIGTVGVHDSFYELGGHSLLAVQIVSRLRKRFDVELPLRSFFETLTIAKLAPVIQTLIAQKVSGSTGDDMAYGTDLADAQLRSTPCGAVPLSVGLNGLKATEIVAGATHGD